MPIGYQNPKKLDETRNVVASSGNNIMTDRSPVPLEDKAKEILNAMVASSGRMLVNMSAKIGLIIIIGEEHLTITDPREQASVLKVISELVTQNFITQVNDTTYHVTESGYKESDSLNNNSEKA